jgi:hypothetical protein
LARIGLSVPVFQGLEIRTAPYVDGFVLKIGLASSRLHNSNIDSPMDGTLPTYAYISSRHQTLVAAPEQPKGAISRSITVSQRTFLEDFRRKINLQILWKCSEAAAATKSTTVL